MNEARGFSSEEMERVLLLRSLHCCQRCVLRFLGHRTNFVYSNPRESCPSLWVEEAMKSSKEEIEKSSCAEPNESVESGTCALNSQAEESVQTRSQPAQSDASTESVSPVQSQTDPELPLGSSVAVEISTPDSKSQASGTFDGESKTAESLTTAVGTETPGAMVGDTTEKETKICPACLGILQELCSEDFMEKVCSEVKSREYDFSTFMLTLTLPLQLEIRQHCLLTYLNEVCKSSLKSSDITPVKEVFKWVCGPLMNQQLRVPFSPKSHFEVGLTFEHNETKKEVDILYEEVADREPAAKKRRFGKNHTKKNQDGPTRYIISSALKGLAASNLKRLLPHPPTAPEHVTSLSIECLHEPVYFAGRYTKHSRHLSQTPWILDGERKTESSVEELLCNPIKQYLRATDYKFCSSGREDVDVRTLGRGRPFVAEIINPRKCVFTEEDCKQLQEVITKSTSDVGVKDLQVVGRDAHMKLKEGEAEKKKSYMALVRVTSQVCQQDLEVFAKIKELVLRQKTPLRVLHRRPLATRERTVHSMSAEMVDGHHFKLFLCTQAGTYIKEFVHGDLGRTQPNVGTLLNTDADILELDVMAVHVDWPQQIDD